MLLVIVDSCFYNQYCELNWTLLHSENSMFLSTLTMGDISPCFRGRSDKSPRGRLISLGDISPQGDKSPDGRFCKGMEREPETSSKRVLYWIWKREPVLNCYFGDLRAEWEYRKPVLNRFFVEFEGRTQVPETGSKPVLCWIWGQNGNTGNRF